MEEVILYGKFQMLPSCNLFYDVSLSRKNIMFVEVTNSGRQRKLVSILMENIIGCKLYNSKLSRDICSYFKVITLRKDKKNIRQKFSFTFRVNASDNKDENYNIAENWACMINWILYNPMLSVAELRAKEDFPPQKRYFVAINPKSGPGKSLQLFKNRIEPLFIDANIKYEVFITEYSGHLMDKILTFDYKQWDTIVICSGDGLVFEFINGIMRRADWRDVIKLPIGILPTGSGNALAASILHSAKEKCSLVNSVYVLLKGSSQPMDLFSVSSEHESYYGFLSVSWGMYSDIDIESEKLRAIGPLRFTIGAINRILNLRHYGGIFSYLPGKSSKDIESGSEVSEHDCSSSSISTPENIEVLNEAGSVDDLSLQSCDETDFMRSRAIINTCDQEICTSTNDVPIKNLRTIDSADISSNSVLNKNKENIKLYGPESNLPDLDKPLPDDWVTVEGQFINVILSSLSHIGLDMHNSPGTYFDDGVLNLQYMKEGPKAGKLFKVMTSIDTGKHVNIPEIEIDNVKAFRLIPAPNYQGNIAVDGESIDYKPIQGEVHPSLANIIMIS